MSSPPSSVRSRSAATCACGTCRSPASPKPYGATTALVAFSSVQSADGRVADLAAVRAAAAAHGARTLLDATQSAGWFPLDAGAYDYTVTGGFKFLLCPRGTSFLTVTEEAQATLPNLFAGWVAAGAPWTSNYGALERVAPGARGFDEPPAFLSYHGAEHSLALLGEIGTEALYTHATSLAARLRSGLTELGHTVVPGESAIVSVPGLDGREPQAREGRDRGLDARREPPDLLPPLQHRGGCRPGAGRAGRVSHTYRTTGTTGTVTARTGRSGPRAPQPRSGHPSVSWQRFASTFASSRVSSVRSSLSSPASVCSCPGCPTRPAPPCAARSSGHVLDQHGPPVVRVGAAAYMTGLFEALEHLVTVDGSRSRVLISSDWRTGPASHRCIIRSSCPG
ncbi:hercynylcysteine sulfoxide lyase [Streptomyces microflavus]